MNMPLTFRINYPLTIFTESFVNFKDFASRKEIFSRSLFYNLYENKKNKLLENRAEKYRLLGEKVCDYISQKYASRAILSVSLFGSALYSNRPQDYDFLVILEGNIFALEETKLKVRISNKEVTQSVGISIKGIDNLSLGLLDLKANVPFKHQSQIINRTAISLYRRHIPLKGYDFVTNNDFFLSNCYAQIDDLLSNSYNLYYKQGRIGLTELQRAKKIISRLYEAASYEEVFRKTTLNSLKKEIYLIYKKKEISLREAQDLYVKFKESFLKKSEHQRKDSLSNQSFMIDEHHLNSIYRKTNNLIFHKRIGLFLPVVSKIVSSSGEVLAFSSRIKGKGKTSFSLHAEIHGIRQVHKRNRLKLKGATLYCSLEPCSHCAKEISESGIKRVVYAIPDPLLDYYGRKRGYYLKKRVAFNRHDSPDLLAKFQRIFIELYERRDKFKRNNVLDVLLERKLKRIIAKRLTKYWKAISLPSEWIPTILKTLTHYHSNEDEAINEIRLAFPAIIDSQSKSYSLPLRKWRKHKIENLSNLLMPHIHGGYIADVGGRVTDFAERIIKLNRKLKKVYVTDIAPFSSASKEHRISTLLHKNALRLPLKGRKLTTVILSLVLHHLKKEDQIILLTNISSLLKREGRIILIEDTYGDIKKPSQVNSDIRYFLNLKEEEKHKILAFYDWFGNRLMRNRDEMILTYEYRSMNDWRKVFEDIKFRQTFAHFITHEEKELSLFPPKGVMVFEKS